jgi:hypothetical protein
MSADAYTSIPATIGVGFVGGLLLGYALRKVVKLVAVVVGLFIAGLCHKSAQRSKTKAAQHSVPRLLLYSPTILPNSLIQ